MGRVKIISVNFENNAKPINTFWTKCRVCRC